MYVEDSALEDLLEWEEELYGSLDPKDLQDLADVRRRLEKLLAEQPSGSDPDDADQGEHM